MKASNTNKRFNVVIDGKKTTIRIHIYIYLRFQTIKNKIVPEGMSETQFIQKVICDYEEKRKNYIKNEEAEDFKKAKADAKAKGEKLLKKDYTPTFYNNIYYEWENLSELFNEQLLDLIIEFYQAPTLF